MSISASSEWDAVRSYENRRNFNSTFAVAVDTDFPIRDQFYEGKINYEQNAPFLQHSLILAIVSGTLFLIAAVWLTMAAGRNEKDDELRLTAFDRWKTEIAAAVVIGVWICGYMAVRPCRAAASARSPRQRIRLHIIWTRIPMMRR